MNWSKGLFRAWLFFSVIWVAISVASFVANWPQHVEWQAANPTPPRSGTYGAFDDLVPKKPNYFDKFDTDVNGRTREQAEAYEKATAADHITNVVYVGFIPPIVIFVLGWGLLWIGRGFKS